jgi:peptidoglycan hydrolase CwlO-like protein
MKKKIVVAAVLLASISAVAFASFTVNKKKAGTEQKMEKQKKGCSHICPFS